jgi:hypothetical protein
MDGRMPLPVLFRFPGFLILTFIISPTMTMTMTMTTLILILMCKARLKVSVSRHHYRKETENSGAPLALPSSSSSFVPSDRLASLRLVSERKRTDDRANGKKLKGS